MWYIACQQGSFRNEEERMAGRSPYIAAAAPIAWGTTYLTTTELLPPGRPLLDACLRALPAGLLLTAWARHLPPRGWWTRAAILGALNIGLFFGLLFIAAERLPGGIAGPITATQPLIVAALAWPLLGERPSSRRIVAGLAGVAGVALMVLESGAALDTVGVAAALGAAASMASGVVLAKRWRPPEGVTAVAVTGWQLAAGGLLLLPAVPLAEGLPATLTTESAFGFLYLGAVGTALAYSLWFSSLQRLPAVAASLMTLLSPLTAVLLGAAVAGESLTPSQVGGVALVLGAVVAGQAAVRPRLKLNRPQLARTTETVN
jgi:probable blue pigment (indigoidine) exporter